MLVMPANSGKAIVHYWGGRYPGLVGHLYSPEGWRGPFEWLPYALDNGAFSAFRHGRAWDREAFLELTRRAAAADVAPRWVLAPDVVGDRDATLRLWDTWRSTLSREGWPIALALQDGMTPTDASNCGADVLFIGGSTPWKRRQLRDLTPWRLVCERIHVGRINGARWLWLCAEQQVESCDGTGWFRGDPVQLAGLADFLARYAAGERRRAHGPLFSAAVSHA